MSNSSSTIIRQEAENGNRSALQAVVLLRRMLEKLTEDYEAVKDLAVQEHQERHASQEVTIDGATIKKYPGRTTYSYSHIPAIALLEKQVKAKQEVHKYAAQVMMQKGEQVVDETTGEVIEPAKWTNGKDSIAISL